MKVHWNDQLKSNQISLAPSFFYGSEVIPRKCILHYGNWRREVDIVLNDTLSKKDFQLSKRLLGDLSLPEAINYQLKWDGRNLCIGPVIAFFTVSRKKQLIENLDRFKPYFSIYPAFSGLVYICSNDSVDMDNKTIEGYYLDPSDLESPWKDGIFPYPNSIYRKTGFTGRLYNEFISEIGDRMFNTYFFNKWELWEWLGDHSKCTNYLPYTERLENREQLERMLDQYGEVYLKQVAGHKAKGIIKVYRNEEGMHFQYRLKGTVSPESNEMVDEFLNEINEKRNYLVQQAIPIKQYDERNFDFRVIMQKDGHGKWICNANIARFGKQKSIATNFLLDGFALSGVEAIKRVFNLTERDAFKKEQEMIHACKLICEQLDRCAGHYGDLGVDVIIDADQKIWVLEVNKLHDHKYPQYALEDEQMYYRVVTTPFAYASYLAGFN